jgi:hypothetical protein
MEVTKFRKNKITGEWEEYTIEEDGDFVFSTHTDVPIKTLKKSKKNEDRISKNQE